MDFEVIAETPFLKRRFVNFVKKHVRGLTKKVMALSGRGSRRRSFSLPAGRTPRIAYLIAGGIGDGVMTLPALTFLRKRFPQSGIDVFAPAAKAALLDKLLEPFPVFAIGPANLTALLMRFGRYDCLLTNVIGAFRVSYELAARFSARYSAGFRYPGENAERRWYDLSLEIADSVHDIDQNLSLVAKTTGSAIEESDRQYQLDLSEYSTGENSRKTSGILLHPGTEKGYEYKQWPLENYREIIARSRQAGYPVTVLLGPAENGLRALFAARDGVTIVQTPDPLLFVNTIQNARLFVGNDSGPVHCAARYGVPSITLIGPASPLRTAPRGPRARHISASLPCAPCHFKGTTCDNPECMKSISVEAVWKAMKAELDNKDNVTSPI
jgi:ADP-heptose:LPS heptosyltransferase